MAERREEREARAVGGGRSGEMIVAGCSCKVGEYEEEKGRERGVDGVAGARECWWMEWAKEEVGLPCEVKGCERRQWVEVYTQDDSKEVSQAALGRKVLQAAMGRKV
ncbi:hypothetical protein AMTR_s00122p00038850 [Amborella trichopoda]|uniref:Uncharacterized protein n=1 Tax=Amborella trichopoda TaxID=13333 RepID=W1NN49_AMBTC|nr:hypothetical protein AMTR_s00122p00038850 [Amborella trichopoda]